MLTGCNLFPLTKSKSVYGEMKEELLTFTKYEKSVDMMQMDQIGKYMRNTN